MQAPLFKLPHLVSCFLHLGKKITKVIIHAPSLRPGGKKEKVKQRPLSTRSPGVLLSIREISLFSAREGGVGPKRRGGWLVVFFATFSEKEKPLVPIRYREVVSRGEGKKEGLCSSKERGGATS